MAASDAEEREQPEDRAPAGDRFTALFSSARPDDELISTTAPGDTIQLFATEPPPPPALKAFTAGAGTESGPAFVNRERLREERARLVALLARQAGATHREVNAEANRAIGIRSVEDATVAQLAEGNGWLERRLARVSRR